MLLVNKIPIKYFYVKYYVKTNNKSDSINFNKFIKSLEKIKWEFKNEKYLINFTKKYLINYE